MTNSQSVLNSTIVDLEKGEVGGDSSSTLTAGSFTQDDEGHNVESRASSVAITEDLKVYPNGLNLPQNETNEVTRTSTRASCRDVVRALTRISTKSSWKDPGPPPDGGLSGWTQVAMGHLIIMNTWGFINSFGVFQTYYVEALNQTPSHISWVGSIQVFLLFFLGTWTGRLTDAGYFKEIVILGSILQVLGIMMTSLSTQYWQLFLAQGVCVGLGNGCLFCPIVSLVTTYFSKKRSLAIGIVACGSATGGVIFPVMVQQLLPKVGFGWTIRALGFVELACLVACIKFAKQRLPPRRAGPIVEWGAFKELPYVLFAIGMFFIFWGVYFAFYYIASFARNIISVGYDESINLILVLNGVGAIGRLLPNFYADRITGPLNMLIPICAVGALIVYCWTAVGSRSALYVWAIAYGLVGAAIQSLFPAVLAGLTLDLRKRGVRMGMIFSILSFAVLTGPPIEGALIQAGDGRYLYGQLFSATAILIGTLFMIGTRIATSGLILRAKM